MTDLLLEMPSWALSVVGVVGFLLMFSGIKDGQRKKALAGVGVVAVGLLLAGLSRFVDTPGKQVQRLTRRFVAAVEQRDAVAMGAILHPQAALYGLDKQEIVNLAMRYAQQTQLK